MGQLKPSEVRLLIAFLTTVLLLGSFFLYEWYARALAEVNSTRLIRQEERDSLLTMRQQQEEYNQKRVWLNQYQPLARNEFEAREALDRVVSAAGIEAAGLTLVSTPPEKQPRLEPYYWAFERRVVVQGDIQSIVRWLTSLQSESAFRAVTQLHIFPKKKTEPEILTCEVTIEQRYVTEEILNMTQVVMLSPSATPAATPPPSAPAAQEDPADSAANEVPEEKPRKTRVVMPSATGNSSGSPAVTRAPAADEDGVLTGATRGRVVRGPAPPPPMPDDLEAAERQAELRGGTPPPVETAVELPQDIPQEGYEPIPEEPTTIRVDDGEEPVAPGPRDTYDSIQVDGIVGEPFDENTPGAGGAEAEAGLEGGAYDGASGDVYQGGEEIQGDVIYEDTGEALPEGTN